MTLSGFVRRSRRAASSCRDPVTPSRSLAQRITRRLLAPEGAAALPVVALTLLAPLDAFAVERPVDAPEVDARTPALPPEYLMVATEWASVGYHPSARERVRALLPHLDGMRARLRAATGAEVLAGVEIRIAALALEMQHLSPGDPIVPGRVVAYPRQKLVVVAAEPQDAGDDDLAELVTHGLAHLALGEATHGRAVPPWFAEGFADATSGTGSRERLEALALSALRRDVPSIEALGGTDPALSRPLAPITRRAVAADLVEWLEERGSGTGVAAFAAGVAREATPRQAIEAAAGVPLDAVERGHRESLARRFGFAPVLLLAAMAWLVMATISLARRARRALAARRHEGQSEPPMAMPRARRRAASLVARASRDSTAAAAQAGEAVSADPGVPKIRRDGGWHTLH